jgi:phosphoglycolate phosphatase
VAATRTSNLIFDFDGTLADTLPVVIELFHQWSKHPPLTIAQIEHYRSMSMRQVLREVHVPMWRVPRLLATGRGKLNAHLGEVTMFEGLHPVLKQLHASGHAMYVVSSNSTENIDQFLVRHQVKDFFRQTYGGSGLFNKSKTIKRIMQHDGLDPASTYYIGDEVRDIEAGLKAGVQPVSVTWGYNNAQLLQTRNPERLVDQPATLLTIVT